MGLEEGNGAGRGQWGWKRAMGLEEGNGCGATAFRTPV